ncbi:MAG: tetratricopeptide repeat protein [Caldilineaceae bacterium]|nr:tetratricopeptide repeat protein [Caldilineaceae bacterium]
MPALDLALLGRPQIVLQGQPLELTSHKAQALLYYLAMSGQSHSRQTLAGLLWTDLDEAAARRNLRVELLKVRADLDAFLRADRDTIAFERTTDHQLDVARFEAHLKSGEATFEQLREAVALYRGEFLEDFHVRDAPFFEEWVTNERERLWQMVRRASLQLVNHYIQRRNYTDGIACANLLLKSEPWSEEAHQQIMRLLALSGQRSAALAQYELCSKALYDEFGVPPSDETNALYDQIETGALGPEAGARFVAPSAAPATVTPAPPLPPPFQAPPALLHFVGRAADLATVGAQLRRAQPNRLLALIGMGGIGKTTLANHLAYDLRGHFADGVLWAYTASTEPLDILGGWAQAYGYDFSGLSDVENRAAALRGVLADKQTLIILDDVRSLSRVRPLLVGSPQSATLLTTRDLDVATALGAHPYLLAEMTSADGEQLLMRILGAERVAAEREAARQICALLQNLPLAVEITAQRLLSRPRRRLADMAERLHNVQDRLDLAISDRAVRTSFMVSWESLDGALQQIFALLGVFGGRSFTASTLAYLANLDVYTTEDRLFALTALSLLSEEAEERYRQHPLLADFAREQLGDDQTAHQRMMAYYLAFAQEYQAEYNALQPEWENMMAGLQMAYQLEEWRAVLDYAEVLTVPWFIRAHYGEARQAYALAKTAAIRLNDHHALSMALLHWGRACIEQNDAAEAVTLLHEGIQLCTEQQDYAGIAAAQYYLARLNLEQGQYKAAEELLVISQSYREALADNVGVASVHYQRAFLAYLQGKLAEALAACTQALTMYETLNHETDLVPALRLLADIALEQKQYDKAEAYCKRALQICEKLHDRGELTATYYSLTVVARLQEKMERAEAYAKQALELSNLIGNRLFHALALHELSRIYAHQNALALGVQAAQQSLQLLLDLQDTFNQVYLLRQLGDLHYALGDRPTAYHYWQEGLQLAEQKNHPLTPELRQRVIQVSQPA